MQFARFRPHVDSAVVAERAKAATRFASLLIRHRWDLHPQGSADLGRTKRKREVSHLALSFICAASSGLTLT